VLSWQVTFEHNRDGVLFSGILRSIGCIGGIFGSGTEQGIKRHKTCIVSTGYLLSDSSEGRKTIKSCQSDPNNENETLAILDRMRKQYCSSLETSMSNWNIVDLHVS